MHKTKKHPPQKPTLLILILTLILLTIITQQAITTHAYLSTQPPITQLWQTDLGGDVYSVGWSPDSEKIAAGLKNGKIIVLNANNGNTIWQTDLGYYSSVWSVGWSPDGEKIAAGGSFDKVIVFDANNGNTIWQSGDLGSRVNSVGWSPDSEKIAAGLNNGKIIVLNANNGNTIWQTDLGSSVLSVGWSPDGEKIAAGLGNGNVIVLNANNGNTIWQTDLGSSVLSVSWSPDSTKIAAGLNNGKIIVFGGGFIPFGVVTLKTSNIPAKITITNTQNQTQTLTLTLNPNQTQTLYASPGNYTITYNLNKPNNYIGPTNTLNGTITITIKTNSYKTITIPSYNELLGVLSFYNSGRIKLNIIVLWDNNTGKRTLELDPGQKQTLYASPGDYRIVYEPEGRFGFLFDIDNGVREVSVREGEVLTVPVKPGFSPVFYLIVFGVVVAVYLLVFHPRMDVLGVVPSGGKFVLGGVAQELELEIRKKGLLPLRRTVSVRVGNQRGEVKIRLLKPGVYRIKVKIE